MSLLNVSGGRERAKERYVQVKQDFPEWKEKQ